MHLFRAFIDMRNDHSSGLTYCSFLQRAKM